MRKLSYKRWGAHEVTSGAKKGSIHVATRSYARYAGELSYLGSYLTSRVLPQDPEETKIAQIILHLQNILEYEIELAIASFVAQDTSEENKVFLARIRNDFVTFKAKLEWSFARGIIGQRGRDVMEEVRRIRNDVIHSRPTPKRKKYHYFDKPLMTSAATRRLFTEVDNTVRYLRAKSGNPESWNVVPPDYAKEMAW